MALPLLFLKLHIIIIIILILSLVFGHGGMALWTLGIFLLLFVSIKMLNIKTSAYTSLQCLQQLNTKLALLLTIFSIYVAYTAILMVLKGAAINVFETLIAFLRGERIIIAPHPIQIQAPISPILGVISIAILAALGLVRTLEGNNILLRLLALFL